jgi:hypothetical protein
MNKMLVIRRRAMKLTTVVAGAVLAAGLANTAGAQQNLSDVAGKIKLKKPESGSVVIDQRSVGRMVRSGPAGTAGDVLLDTTTRCADAARSLSDLLAETGSGEVFYDNGWRARVKAAGETFDEAHKELGFAAVPARFEAAYDSAQSGSDEVAAGLEILRQAIAMDRPQFTEAKKTIAAGNGVLDQAMAEMRRVLREENAEQLPPTVDALELSNGIRELCRRRYTEGSDGYDYCVSEQEKAAEAISSRFAFNVGLEESDFNTIRNGCLYEWPDDLVQRNACERRRISSVSQ